MGLLQDTGIVLRGVVVAQLACNNGYTHKHDVDYDALCCGLVIILLYFVDYDVL